MNKKITFYIFLVSILFSLKMNGQKITMRELVEQTVCEDSACYAAFMATKNFSFIRTSDNKYQTLYQYISIDSLENSKTKVVSSLHLSKSGSIMTEIQTFDNQYFNQLINQLSPLGFHSHSTEHTADDTTQQFFVLSNNRSLRVIAITINKKDASGKMSPIYSVIVDRNLRR